MNTAADAPAGPLFDAIPGMSTSEAANVKAGPRQAEPRLLDRLREAIRVLHCSIPADDAYGDRVRRFILLHGKRRPPELGAAEHAARARRSIRSEANRACSGTGHRSRSSR